MLPIAVFPTDKPRQFVIARPDDSRCPMGMEFDDYYVQFSGYFGSYGPSMFAAAPDLLSALKALLPEVDAEIERRRTSGDDQYWSDLQPLSDAAHAALAKAEGR